MYNQIPESNFGEIAEWLGKDVKKFAGKTVLILGGGGSLGEMYRYTFLYFNKYILKKNPIKIISVDSYVGRKKPVEVQDKNITYIDFDLTKPFEHLFENEKIDYLLACQGLAQPAQYSKYPHLCFDISTITVKYALELAKKKGAKILNFSSSEVLAESKDKPLTEKSFPCVRMGTKRTIYDTGKIAIEGLSGVYWEERDPEFKGFVPYVVRAFNVFAFNRHDDGRVIPNWISAAIKNETIKVYGDGQQSRTPCFFLDFIYGTLLLILKGRDHLFHIANPAPEVTMLELAHLINKISGKNCPIELVPSPAAYIGEPRCRNSSIEFANQKLGYIPHISLEEGLRRVWEWALKTYPKS